MKKSSEREQVATPQTVVEAMLKNQGELTPWQVKELKRTIAGIIAGI